MVQSPSRRIQYVFYVESYVRYLEPSEAVQKNHDCTQFTHNRSPLALPQQQHWQQINGCSQVQFLSSFTSAARCLLVCYLGHSKIVVLSGLFSFATCIIHICNCLIYQLQHWQQISGCIRVRSITVVIHICGSVFVGMLFAPLNNCCPAL